ncbi:MAG: VOC family protein [Eubacteriales bacterium]|nr:VOC family protein [Eubacteriales bacterium]
MVYGLEHVALCAKEPKKLVDWYVEYLNFRIVYDNGKGTYFIALPEGDMIEIFAADIDTDKSSSNGSGLRHLALSVNDFETVVEKLKGAGVQELPELAKVNDKIKTYFFRDPEGNILHLIYRVDPLY